jgi:hypothetical protein
MADPKFIATSKSERSTIAWCRAQDAFLARARLAIERAKRDGSGISPEELLSQMDQRLDAARRLLARRGSAPAKPAP